MTSQWPPVSPDSDPMSQQPDGGQPAWVPAYVAPSAYSHWQDGAPSPPRPRPDYGIRRDLGPALLIVAALAVAGIGAGFLWHAVSARPHLIESPAGGFGLPADTDKNYFGAEASFFAVTVIAGFLSGIITWFISRRRGPSIAVALALGSAAAGLLVRAIGESQTTNETLAKACGRDPGFDAICAVYNGHLRLRVVGLTLTWAITSLAVFLTLSAFAGRAHGQFERWPPPWEQPTQLQPHGQSWPPAGVVPQQPINQPSPVYQPPPNYQPPPIYQPPPPPSAPPI